MEERLRITRRWTRCLWSMEGRHGQEDLSGKGSDRSGTLFCFISEVIYVYSFHVSEVIVTDEYYLMN